MRFWKTDDDKIPQELEKAWLYRVCRNLAIDHKRRQGVVIAVGDQNELDSFSSGAMPHAAGPEQDALAEVMSHVQTLSANQQEVIRLRYQHDLSYKEISKITGHSVSNVGVLIHEAMRRLKKLMSGDEGPSTEGAV